MAQQDLGKALAKKGGLTLAQLASYDDVLTDALVDRVYFWATIRKNRARFSPSRGIQEEEIASVLRSVVICEKDAKEATDGILQLSGIRKYVDRLKTADEKEHFQRHLRKYVNIYLPDCPFEVTTTNRYTIDTHGASVTARKEIKKGEIVKYLSGIQVAITEDEFKALSRDDVRLDFSIVHSSRKKTPSLFLGPARFANRDCSANARLSTTGSHGMQIIATRDVAIDDEITVTYGTDYFGEDNCECLCVTCERLRRNGWALHTGDTEDEDEGDEDMQDTEEIDVTEGYSLRRKRKSDALDDDSLRSGSSTPKGNAKRLKVDLPESIDIERQATPRGRRTIREVKIKSEHPLKQSMGTLPSVTVTSDAHVTANITVQPEAECSDPTTQTRNSRASSGDSANSRSSSTAASSVFSQQSARSQGTGVTSDDEVKDRIVVKIPGPASSSTAAPFANPKAAVTRTVDIDVKTTATITQADEDSDGELTTLSQFSTDSSSGEATRKRKIKEKKKKLWNRELAALREGSMERHLVEELEEPPAILTTEIDLTLTSYSGRIPGDYTLTTKLLCGPYSRWVNCQTCEASFVQEDAYLTRKECPRCERHSKLYGYGWPKTDREGRWDTEGRVLDHREVHRFVEPTEEKKIRKGGRKSLAIEVLRGERASASAERDSSVGTVGTEGSPRRGARRRTSRLTM